MVPDALFDADLTARDGEPVITANAAAAVGATAALSMDVANVFANGPTAGIVDHEGVEACGLGGMFERTFLFRACDFAHFQGVGLTHDDEDFNLLAHVGRFAIRVG